jgi:cytoskeletal protein CcmA (bactofilin family)/Tfp pilus assembly protein PilV
MTWKQLYRDQRGMSVAIVMFAFLTLATVGATTLAMVAASNRTNANSISSVQAFWAAEAGMELTFKWLRYQNPPPAGTNSFYKYQDLTVGNAKVTVEVIPNQNNPTSYLKRYSIVSTGSADGVQRKIRVEVGMTTFGRYAYLTGSEGGTIWFATGDVIEGALHSNDQISIMGSPVFKGKLTSSATSFRKGTGYNPKFEQGYQLGVPPVYFPTVAEVEANYKVENGSGPSFTIDATGGRRAKIRFNADGTFTYSVWRQFGSYKIYDIKDKVVPISDVNGLIYVDGNVRVSGVVKGQLSVAATGNIWIVNDIVYASSDANGKPPANSTDLLGLISNKNVIVANTTPNRSDVIINAAILTLNSSFTVQDYDSGAPRGKLTVYGSISQKVRGPVGTISWWGGTTGYKKDYHYDERFVNTPPPYFPVTGQYDTYSWTEVF